MSEQIDKAQCSVEVSDGGRWPHFTQCTRSAVVTRNNIPYCKIHDPEYKQQKRAAQTAKWDAQWDTKKKMWERTTAVNKATDGLTIEELKTLTPAMIKATPDMYEALKAICTEHGRWCFEELAEALGNTNTQILKDTIEKGKQALSKAEGKV
jgi:hypothetical protein